MNKLRQKDIWIYNYGNSDGMSAKWEVQPYDGSLGLVVYLSEYEAENKAAAKRIALSMWNDGMSQKEAVDHEDERNQ